MSEILGGVILAAVIIHLVTAVMVIWAGFRQSIWWGLGCLLTPVLYVFPLVHPPPSWRVVYLLYGSLLSIILLVGPATKGMDFAADVAANEDAQSYAFDQQITPVEHSQDRLDPRLIAELEMRDYSSQQDFKAVAYAGAEQERWVFGYATERSNREEANRAAIEFCRKFAQQYNISKPCRLVIAAQ